MTARGPLRAARVGIALVAMVVVVSLGARPANSDPPDPLLPLLQRIDSYFHRHEIDGITKDVRYPLNPTEVIRLSVVSQLLAYNDLYATDSLPGCYQDIVDRGEFLLAHMDDIMSRTAFDGMLAYALLGAYEITNDVRYLNAARPIVARCKALSGFQNTLNWGLMSAMGLAKYYDLTGDVASLNKTREIVGSCVHYQHSDGSFPHYCANSTDVHYTGWMGMELIHVGRYVSHPSIDPMLSGVRTFLDQRVNAEGRTVYEEPCPGNPLCTKYYYGLRSGCPVDYDTRAWVNELGYSALVFDHFQDPKYQDVMGFLYTLENKVGTFPDKWDFFPPPSDDIYPWAVGDSSVIRTSVVFWSLATFYRSRLVPVPRRYDLVAHEALSERSEPPGDENPGRGPRPFRWFAVDSLVLADADAESVCPPAEFGVASVFDDAVAGRAARLELASGSPVRGVAMLRLTLPTESDASLTIFDASGRRVGTLLHGRLAAGQHLATWNSRDAAGRACPNGLYFAQFRAGTEAQSLKLLVLR